MRLKLSIFTVFRSGVHINAATTHSQQGKDSQEKGKDGRKKKNPQSRVGQIRIKARKEEKRREEESVQDDGAG